MRHHSYVLMLTSLHSRAMHSPHSTHLSIRPVDQTSHALHGGTAQQVLDEVDLPQSVPRKSDNDDDSPENILLLKDISARLEKIENRISD